MFVTPEFAVRDLAVLEDVSSDHLPVHARLCLTGRPADSKRREPVSPEDRRDVKQVLQEYREEQRGP